MTKIKKPVVLIAVFILSLSLLVGINIKQVHASTLRAHGFDMAKICYSYYNKATGNLWYYLTSKEYSVRAMDPHDAYSWLCFRDYKYPASDPNFHSGLNKGEYHLMWESWVYTFNLNDACKAMNKNGVVRLGNPKDAYSWSCWY